MALVPGKNAPNFKCDALVNGNIVSFDTATMQGQYYVLLFYPGDFTFVCPTELWAFSERSGDFQKVNCSVFVISTDSVHTHMAWYQTPRQKGGVSGLDIPMLADRNHLITKNYGILTEEGTALRGTFIIDGNGIIRHIDINDSTVGRSAEETMRLVLAFQYVDEHGEVCPATWKPGSRGILPTHEGIVEYSSQKKE